MYKIKFKNTQLYRNKKVTEIYILTQSPIKKLTLNLNLKVGVA